MRTSSMAPVVSRRTALAGLGAGGVGLALAASHHASAQDATPTPLAGHPLIGAWYVRVPEPTPTPAPALISFTADGIVTQLDPHRGNAMGSWAATGARTALVTLVFLTYASENSPRFESFAVARDLIEVDATGDALAGQGEIEFRAIDGTTVGGPFGPLPLDGTRIPVEAMATAAPPVATPAP